MRGEGDVGGGDPQKDEDCFRASHGTSLHSFTDGLRIVRVSGYLYADTRGDAIG